MDSFANNKRIAKNTLLLYFRMIILMLVALYTSRVVLDALGEVDYGIYNVVGGLVAMFSILSSSLSKAISRFITYELGNGNVERLKRIFCTSVNMQVIMALLLFGLCELIGGWFLNEKMNIPIDRLPSANWVLQFSIATFLVGLVSLPYNAVIIAHERMGAFAYIGILEAVLKLIIAFLIYVSPFDKLVLYAFLIFVVSVIIRIIYGIYCARHFPETKYQFILDLSLLKKMGGFAGWNMFGNTAYIFNTQGINMLINIYFGVTTNAARAIAIQVENAVTQFVNNILTAITPQIIKSYANKDYEFLYKLVCRGSKYSFFVMLMFIVPIVLEADYILGIWLKKVPEDSVIFIRLVMLTALVSVVGNPMTTAIMATGMIKRYQIYATMLSCLVFPFTWAAYLIGCPAYVTYIIFAIVYFSLYFVSLYTLRQLVDFPVIMFVKSVLARICPCILLSLFFPALLVVYLQPSFLRLVLVVAVSLVWSSFCIYIFGMNRNERLFFRSKALQIMKKKSI